MKKLTLREMIRKEIRLLKEGHSGEVGPLSDMAAGKQPKTKDEAIKMINSWIKSSRAGDYGDLKKFRGVRYVGNTTEDRMDSLAQKSEDDKVIVGIVDGEFWMAYWSRS